MIKSTLTRPCARATLAIAAIALTLAGCGSSARTLEDAGDLSVRALELVADQAAAVDRSDLDAETQAARLRYLGAVRSLIARLDARRLAVRAADVDRDVRRLAEETLEIAYRHAIFFARFPGKFTAEGDPADDETAAALEGALDEPVLPNI